MAETKKKTYYVSSKSKWLTLLLSVLGLIGLAGFHRFYVGKILSGCLYFCTLGFLGLGTIYDVIKICVDDFEDADGFPLYADSSMQSNYKRRNLQSPPGIKKIVGSICASFVLFLMVLSVLSFTLAEFLHPTQSTEESITNENTSMSKNASNDFTTRIKECESQVTKEEMDSFLDDAKEYRLKESDVKQLCATLKALNVEILTYKKVNLHQQKQKVGGPHTGYVEYKVKGVDEIVFRPPNIDNAVNAGERYLVIHLDEETKQVKSISIRKTFDPFSSDYNKLVYYLCIHEENEKGGRLNQVGDKSKIFISKEAKEIMKEKINRDVKNNNGKIEKIDFYYKLSSTNSEEHKYDEPYVIASVICMAPSQTYGVNEEKIHKPITFSIEGDIKNNPQWKLWK